MKVCSRICHPFGAPPEGYPCAKPPTLFEGGKDWCYDHAPSREREQAAARRERWLRQAAVKDARVEIARREAVVLRAAAAWALDPNEGDALRYACAELQRANNALQTLLASKDASR